MLPLEENGGEWEGNSESKAESSLETDALRVFTKTTIQEENSPATLHPTTWGRRNMGCSSWAGARGTMKLAQAAGTPSKHPAPPAGQEHFYWQFTVRADQSLQ